LIDANGDTTIYSDPDAEIPDPNDPEIEIRRFDCMDCHNRPSHLFTPPAVALNLAISTGQLSGDLPYIRSIGLDLLNAEYEDRNDARQNLSNGLIEYYQEEYPEIFESRRKEVDNAIEILQGIYSRNFFPEMKTDYRDRENNLSHFVNDGCFRCHDGIKQDAEGNKISYGCTTCHLIVAQGPSEKLDDLESNITGLDFVHPEDIDEMWMEMKCTDCHDPESGY
jgi:hypothetical protein